MNTVFFSVLTKRGRVGQIPNEPTDPPVTGTVQIDTADTEYTTWDQPSVFFQNRSAFATTKFSTTGTSIELGIYTDITETKFLNEAKVSIYDSLMNWVTTVEPQIVSEKQTFIVNLPSAGTYHIVEGGTITAGGQNFQSTSVVEITGNEIVVEDIPLNDDCVINIGDSISVGDGTTNNSRYAYQMLLRKAMPTLDFIADGCGGETIRNRFRDEASITTAVNRIKAEFDRRAGRKIILFTLGTNDYGLNRRLSDVDPMTQDFFDKAHELITDCEIIILSPLVRENEDDPNLYGHTLQDYRDAFAAAASTRAWVTYYDGKNILTLPDDFVSDGLHPSNVGHQKIATHLETIL